MKPTEPIEYCRCCTNKVILHESGLICSLTGEKPDFKEICSNFTEDIILKNEILGNKYPSRKSYKDASQGKRFTNFLIDLVFYWIFTFFFVMTLGFVFSIINPNLLIIFKEDDKVMNYLLAFIAGMLYYTFMEATTGRTIGKFITKTKVITENGQKPDILTILARSFFRYIPFECFSFLGDGRGWHDSLTKTRVIEEI